MSKFTTSVRGQVLAPLLLPFKDIYAYHNLETDFKMDFSKELSTNVQNYIDGLQSIKFMVKLFERQEEIPIEKVEGLMLNDYAQKFGLNQPVSLEYRLLERPDDEVAEAFWLFKPLIEIFPYNTTLSTPTQVLGINIQLLEKRIHFRHLTLYAYKDIDNVSLSSDLINQLADIRSMETEINFKP